MLYLASKSPRRRELLERLGHVFKLIDLDIPEARRPDETAEAYVRRVALEKARAGLERVSGDAGGPGDAGAYVLGSDTEVILDDEVFGKPADAGDAAAMLRRLSGRTHQVVSAVWLVSAGRELEAVSRSEVSFDTLDEARISDYIATGEAFGKAGAYAIQGAAEVFVRRLEGSYSGVMGLPLHETDRLLRQAGLQPAGVPADAGAVA